MKKLYAGIATTALAAAGLACGMGAANAVPTAGSVWPDQFHATQIATTTDGTSFVLGSYDTGQQAIAGDGTPYEVIGSALVKVDGTSVTSVDLGTDADPLAITAAGNTVYVVGNDAANAPQAWTVASDAASGSILSTLVPDWPMSIAVSPDGSSLGIGGTGEAVVEPVAGGGPTATAAFTTMSNDVHGAFSPDGDTYYVATDNDTEGVDLWSVPTDGITPPSSVTVATKTDAYAAAGPVVAGTDGTVYVATTNGDKSIKVVTPNGVVDPARTQSINGNVSSMALSPDGATLYEATQTSYGFLEALPVARLGTLDDQGDPASAAPSYEASASVNALAVTADGAVVAAETMVDANYAVTGNAVDVIAAPGAPSHVTATRGETYAEVSFDPATATGSSAWPSTDASGQGFLEYTITLHDTTDASKADIVRDYIWNTAGLHIGDDAAAGQAPMVPGDTYTVSVTATNGLFTSQAATFTLPAYQAPTTGGSGDTAPTPSPTSTPTPGTGTTTQPPAPVQTPPPAPEQVGSIKAPTLTAGGKKLTLKLTGVTDVPGKVKVYDGKKLIGTATVEDGKLTVKLKHHLDKGKHNVTVKYAGSAQVAKFSKTVHLKVK